MNNVTKMVLIPEEQYYRLNDIKKHNIDSLLSSNLPQHIKMQAINHHVNRDTKRTNLGPVVFSSNKTEIKSPLENEQMKNESSAYSQSLDSPIKDQSSFFSNPSTTHVHSIEHAHVPVAKLFLPTDYSTPKAVDNKKNLQKLSSDDNQPILKPSKPSPAQTRLDAFEMSLRNLPVVNSDGKVLDKDGKPMLGSNISQISRYLRSNMNDRKKTLIIGLERVLRSIKENNPAILKNVYNLNIKARLSKPKVSDLSWENLMKSI